jgi:hypothetical protein
VQMKISAVHAAIQTTFVDYSTQGARVLV